MNKHIKVISGLINSFQIIIDKLQQSIDGLNSAVAINDNKIDILNAENREAEVHIAKAVNLRIKIQEMIK